MLLCVVGSCHNHLGSGIAVDSVVHFILYGCKEIFRDLAVQRVIHCCCINVRDFLIEPPFTGTNLLNLRNQVVKIILIENLTVDQSALVQNISLFGKGVQYLCCPLPELRFSVRIDAVANGNDGRQ